MTADIAEPVTSLTEEHFPAFFEAVHGWSAVPVAAGAAAPGAGARLARAHRRTDRARQNGGARCRRVRQRRSGASMRAAGCSWSLTGG